MEQLEEMSAESALEEELFLGLRQLAGSTLDGSNGNMAFRWMHDLHG